MCYYEVRPESTSQVQAHFFERSSMDWQRPDRTCDLFVGCPQHYRVASAD